MAVAVQQAQARVVLERMKLAESEAMSQLEQARQKVAELDHQIERAFAQGVESLRTGKAVPDPSRINVLRIKRETYQRLVSLLEAEAEAASLKVGEARQALALADEKAHREMLAQEASSLRQEIDQLWETNQEAVRAKTLRLSEIEPTGLGQVEWLMLEVARIDAESIAVLAELEPLRNSSIPDIAGSPDILVSNTEVANNCREYLRLCKLDSNLRDELNRMRKNLARRLEYIVRAGVYKRAEYGPESKGSVIRVLTTAVDLFGRHQLQELRGAGVDPSKLKEFRRRADDPTTTIVDQAERRLALLPVARAALDALSADRE